MALTATRVGNPTVFGDKHVGIFTLAFDSTYPTGGEALTPAQLGLGVIEFVIVEPHSGMTFHYDSATSKLIAWVAGAQVANDVDLSVTGAGLRCLVVGH